jgi:hypothetical protein
MQASRWFLSLGLFAAGTLCGYGVAFWTGAPVPDVVQRLRYRSYASIDEVQLRAALARGERALQHTATTMGRGGTVAASAALARAISFSRAQALRGSTQPLPDDLRELFEPYFAESVLAKARWGLADRRIGLGSLLAGWYYREGAVTLDDVIVYSNPSVAKHRWLVAHELTHVAQYEQLGLRDFARLYTLDWQLLERQASRNASRIIEDIEREERRQVNSDLSSDEVESIAPTSA